MKIEHIALWTNRLEEMRAFYMQYFGATSNEQYHNPAKHFRSYFHSFEDGARLEIMEMKDIPESLDNIYDQFTGLIHFAMATGSREKVDELTTQLREDGYEVIDGPRWTGDGYYESVVLDPDKNRVEITI